MTSSWNSQAYISNYNGHTRITRLLFIADRLASMPERELEALKLAADEVKKVRLPSGRLALSFNSNAHFIDQPFLHTSLINNALTHF